MNLSGLFATLVLCSSFSFSTGALSKDVADTNNKGSSQQLRQRRAKGGKEQAACSRKVYSVVNENPAWDEGHDYHPQVWYHTLEDTHSLWKSDYFDYVLDIRPLQDANLTLADNSTLLLEGWETFHIPGSYPINVFPPDQPVEDIDMLVDFQSSNVCKDSRIFVHCWSGISGNMVAKSLIALGFTNVHAAGPAGSAGMWDWIEAGYDVVRGDIFNAHKMQPSCAEKCYESDADGVHDAKASKKGDDYLFQAKAAKSSKSAKSKSAKAFQN